jgi:hypothetical protein
VVGGSQPTHRAHLSGHAVGLATQAFIRSDLQLLQRAPLTNLTTGANGEYRWPMVRRRPPRGLLTEAERVCDRRMIHVPEERLDCEKP